MTTDGTAAMAPIARPAPAPPRVRQDAAVSFTGIAAVGAAFAGFLSYSRSPDVLATTLAVGLTFLGALIGLHVLHFVFRLAVLVTRIAIPAAVILLIGCACDWPWAETAVEWGRAIGNQGIELAAKGWAAWQAR